MARNLQGGRISGFILEAIRLNSSIITNIVSENTFKHSHHYVYSFVVCCGNH